MNELRLEYNGLNFLYFKTNKKNVDEAYMDFEMALTSVGIIYDNANPVYLEVTDDNYNVLDSEGEEK